MALYHQQYNIIHIRNNMIHNIIPGADILLSIRLKKTTYRQNGWTKI